MTDDYKCLSCNYVFEYKKPHGKEWPESLTCNSCGGTAKRGIKNKFLFVPEHMKAVLDK